MKINVKEKQILHFGVETFAETNNNVGAQVYGGFRNPLGRGETLVFSAKTNQQLETHRDFMVTAAFPFVGHRLGAMTVSARSHRDRQASYFSSYDQAFFTVFAEYLPPGRHTRLKAEISHRQEIPFEIRPEEDDTTSSTVTSSATPPTHHQLMHRTLQTVQRTIGVNEEPRHPSSLIVNSAASSWKTAVKYHHTWQDTRDSIVNPTVGQSLETSVEVALPPGQAQFVKTEVQSQYHLAITRNLWRQFARGEYGALWSPETTYPTPSSTSAATRPENHLVLSLAASVGIMYPLTSFFQSLTNGTGAGAGVSSGAPRRSYLSDRYHMGGPLNLRGFRHAGIGPRAFSTVSDDSVGGDTKRNFLVMLSYPLVQSLAAPCVTTTTAAAATPTATTGGEAQCPITRIQRTLYNVAAGTDMRAFVFANAGSIGSPSYWLQSSATTTSAESQSQSQPQPQQQQQHPLFGFIRLSVGGGLSVIIANTLRLEATYSVPVVYGLHTDHVKPFQLGLGVSLQQ